MKHFKGLLAVGPVSFHEDRNSNIRGNLPSQMETKENIGLYNMLVQYVLYCILPHSTVLLVCKFVIPTE